MGNCFQCFQNQMEHTPATAVIDIASNTSSPVQLSNNKNIEELYARHTPNVNVNTRDQHKNTFKSANTAFFPIKPHETDELLSARSPFKVGNYCDGKRSSFKKSLLLLNGGTTAINEVITAVNDFSEVSDNILNKLFEEYKEYDEDMIMAEGIERLCRDLNYQPDEFAILVLAWCLDASQMCRFTRPEFIEGLHKMHAHSIETIRVRLEQTIEALKVDAEMFKQLYRFTFRFGLEPDQRILPLDMAISLWKLVFTVHTPPLFNKWIHFLDQHPSIRGIPKDTWNMFLNFSEQCDIYNYDDTEAWPSLFDDFVDYEKARQPINPIIRTCDDDNNNDDNVNHYHKSTDECSTDYNVPL